MGFTVDTFLIPVYEAAFVNPFIAPAVWLFLFFVLFPWAQIFLSVACLLFGAFPVILHNYRANSAQPIHDWSNEIVLITGGAHGVGKQVAETLASKHRPKNVVVFDIRSTKFSDEDRICYYDCNVADRNVVKEVANRVIREVGHPTIIINNAGIVNAAKSIVDTKEEDIERVINVNFLGQIWIVKAFLPHMVDTNRGQIVTVASVLGYSGAAYASTYCASKAAAVGFHECLRQELLGTHIRLTSVNPGLIDTGMFTGIAHRFPWLTPPLHVHQVSNAIIKSLEEGRNSDIFLPLYTYAAPLFRFLPIEVADWIRELSGANRDMQTFKYSTSALAT